MMIDGLSFNSIPPIQPRTAADDGEQNNQIKTAGNSAAKTSQSDDQNPSQKGDQKKKLEEVVKSLNDFIQPTHTSLKFQLYEKLNQYYCQVIDDKTNEVIREIPSKKLLDAYATMAEQLGFIIDKKI